MTESRTFRTMLPHRALATAAVLLLFCAAAVPAAASSGDRVRTIEQDLPSDGIRSVSLHGPVGEVDVVASDDGPIRLRAVLECDDDGSRCRDAAEDVELQVRQRGDLLHLEIDDWPKLGNRGLSVEVHLEVPRDRNLEIDWGVGEVDVDGIEADLEIDLGVGEVTVRAPERAIASVNIDTGVGEAELRVGGRSIDADGFIGQSLRWSGGTGEAHIEVDNGVGEIVVKLD